MLARAIVTTPTRAATGPRGSFGHAHPGAAERTALYQQVAYHLETFLASIQSAGRNGPLPRLVTMALRAFLDCGRLARGCCRVHCYACRKDDLVHLACERRGFYPSCEARCTADTAAWLVDRVIPDVPTRQWVLSVPHLIRHLCAFDHHATHEVRAQEVPSAVPDHPGLLASGVTPPKPLRQAIARG